MHLIICFLSEFKGMSSLSLIFSFRFFLTWFRLSDGPVNARLEIAGWCLQPRVMVWVCGRAEGWAACPPHASSSPTSLMTIGRSHQW